MGVKLTFFGLWYIGLILYIGFQDKNKKEEQAYKSAKRR